MQKIGVTSLMAVKVDSIAEFLNGLSDKEASDVLYRCCASRVWVKRIIDHRPFRELLQIKSIADQIWFNLEEVDWLEAFRGHPKIGDVNSLRKKYSNTASWTKTEQSGVESTSDAVLQDLKRFNEEYEREFGFIFIICATGKSAEEMLATLQARLLNSREEELRHAVIEQAKITHLRLGKLL